VQKEKPYHTILSFPDDKIERVVWWYGPIYIKNSTSTTAPEVDVLMRTTDQGIIKKAKKFYTYKIPLSELSIVRIGSLWKGQKSLGKLEKKSISAQFEFNLSNYTPTFAKTFDSDNGKFIIPHDKYSFSYPHHKDNKKNKALYGASRLTKLIALNGVSILIPSLEILTSMYTPNEMDIRRKLITQDFNTLLNDYIEPKKSELINGDTYSIHLKNQKDTSNSVFLAHLALNPITKVRVSNIWPDLQTQSKNRYEARYPSIPPYHSAKLKVSVNGIWLDNKKTFLAFRVNTFSLPNEMKIQRIIKSSGNNNNDDCSSSNSSSARQSIVSSGLPITGYTDPNSNAGVAKTRSQVSILSEKDSDHPIIEDIILTTPQSSGSKPMVPEEAPQQLSSGEENSSSSNRRIAKIEQTEEIEDIRDHYNIDQTQVISLVDEALLELKTSHFISKITYIDENGSEHHNFHLATFPPTLINQRLIGTWPLTFERKSRRCLIVKLELSNSKTLFLLEIERKSKNEAFSGLLFTQPLTSLTSQTVFLLMKAIAINKGKYKKYTSTGEMRLLDITLNEFLVFNHSLIKDSMKNKIETVLLKAKNVFFSNTDLPS